MDSAIVIVGLLLFATLGEAKYCANCDAISSPNLCINYAKCSDGEDCYVEERNENGVRTYKLGCLSSTVCDHVTPYLFGRSTNRRDADSCVQCCKSDGCNTRLCRGQTFLPTTPPMSSFYTSDYIDMSTTKSNGLWKTTETSPYPDFWTTKTAPSPSSSDAVISSMNSPYKALTCSFEHGFCGWLQSSRDDFDWTLSSGYTPTVNTGPSGDHTLGTYDGHYLYTEASSPRRPMDKAQLVSNTLPPRDAGCLQFWYNMYGTGIGSLGVMIVEEHNTTMIWGVTGNQGDAWRYAQVNVQTKNPFQLVIQGIIGDSYLGDMAIDDVSYNHLKCFIQT